LPDTEGFDVGAFELSTKVVIFITMELDKVNSNAIKHSLHLLNGRIYKESSYTDKSRDIADCVHSLADIHCSGARWIENQAQCVSASFNSGICIFGACDSTNLDSGSAHNNSFDQFKRLMIPE
jgi:hypothetical protein